jgi:dephospho-CoA kinase
VKLLAKAIAFIAQDEELPASFRRLTDFSLVILVGLTGVGKSTIISLLKERLDFTLLPDRRRITDDIIITPLQQADGETPSQVADRVKRFEYTARFRALHPGGMAYALSQLAIDPAEAGALLLFDGLRGLNEAQHATHYLPQARFIVLDAPDMVRLTRLLKRGDIFDTTGLPASLTSQNMLATLLTIADIEAVFSEEELRHISRGARAANLSIDEVFKKASIIVEERRNYDSSAARVYLTRTLPRQQVLVIDTAAYPPEAVVEQITKWVE